VTDDLGPCPVCGNTSTYWTFSTVDGDARTAVVAGTSGQSRLMSQELAAGEGITSQKVVDLIR
jgi:hypothetical protein